MRAAATVMKTSYRIWVIGYISLIAAALGDIARAQGMAGIARKTGLGRESLYKTLSREGNPELETVLRVCDAVGLKLKAVPG